MSCRVPGFHSLARPTLWTQLLSFIRISTVIVISTLIGSIPDHDVPLISIPLPTFMLCVLCFLPTHLQKETTRKLRNRITELEEDLLAQSSRGGGGGGDNASAVNSLVSVSVGYCLFIYIYFYNERASLLQFKSEPIEGSFWCIYVLQAYRQSRMIRYTV